MSERAQRGSAASGFFARLGERAVGRPGPLRVRAPQRFEPVQRGGSLGQLGAEAAMASADPSAPPGLDVETVVDAARALLPAKPAAAARPEPGRRVPPPAAAAVPDGSPLGDVVVPVLHPPASRPSLLDEAPRDRPHGAPLRPPPPASATSGSPGRAEDPVDDVTPVAAARRPAAGKLRGAEPVAEPRGESPGPVGLPALAAPAVPVPAVEVPDVDDLVRRHVLPALVARGVAGPHETVEVVTDGPDGASARRRSRPGRTAPTTLTATPARYTIAGGSDERPVRRRRPAAGSPSTAVPAMSGPPDPAPVHVHIERVVVARPAPPPRPVPAPPPPPGRPQPDHEAYLARRREGR